ncbi:F-box/LRR-repeat protein 5-like [Rhopilema esculentum]|uniref:F-box/LRR-repeat protein 5-like n=1 Tax=Rhopilema esculentum TaxID=499914 RepID=UPI0031CFD7A2
MAAVVDRVGITPEIDVFTLPHSKMRQLIVDTTEEVTSTNFEDRSSVVTLLQQLRTTLIQFRLHEEIEDKYIMRVLKKRLDGDMLKKLIKHLHANSHISDLIKLVKNLQVEVASITSEETLKNYGEKLSQSLSMFYEEYLPHMVDEERVFQPLLQNYFTYSELKNIKERVLNLHCIQDDKEKVPATSNVQPKRDQKVQKRGQVQEESSLAAEAVLPSEILLKIFKYLQPRELCRCAQVSKMWSFVAMDPELWTVLHPSRWGRGEWTFGEQTSSDDCNCDCEPNYRMLQFKDEIDEGSSTASDEEDDDDAEFTRESKVLLGISRYLLPKVGKGVKTLVLECSKAVTNGLLYRILSQCPNIEYLDLSQTIISDLGLNGLFKDGGGRKLKYLDVSGCTRITDKTLMKLSTFYNKSSKSEKKSTGRCNDCSCYLRKELKDASHPSRPPSAGCKPKSLKGLECLRLSGCYKITDMGLRALARRGLPSLKHLDLSGCLNVSADGLKDLVSTCTGLNAEELYYCDNITEGPYSQSASGCQNIECKNRVCCRSIVLQDHDIV